RKVVTARAVCKTQEQTYYSNGPAIDKSPKKVPCLAPLPAAVVVIAPSFRYHLSGYRLHIPLGPPRARRQALPNQRGTFRMPHASPSGPPRRSASRRPPKITDQSASYPEIDR